METMSGMLARTIDEDRIRDYSSPARRHAAAARAAKPAGSTSLLRTLFGRLPGSSPRARTTHIHEPAAAEAGA